jgi:hypothetical protein
MSYLLEHIMQPTQSKFGKRYYVLAVMVLLCLVLLLALAGVSYKAWCYRSQRNDSREEFRKFLEGTPSLTTPAPWGQYPFFIFKKRDIDWHALAPLLVENYGIESDQNKKILDSFPIAGDYKPMDIYDIQYDQKTIHFPKPGEYYLHTTVGYFKILILDPQAKKDDQIISLFRFISRNIVHSLADAPLINPIFNKEHKFGKNCYQPFFASDQPLKLHCGYASEFTETILRQLGYQVQRVHLQTHDNQGHLVVQVFFPDQNSYGMIDPDYGAMVRDETGKILSVPEIAKRIQTDGDKLKMIDVANKCWLKQKYNNTPQPTPNFAWSVDKMSTSSTMKNYRDILSRYSDHYALYTYDKKGNLNREPYRRRDGTLIE